MALYECLCAVSWCTTSASVYITIAVIMVLLLILGFLVERDGWSMEESAHSTGSSQACKELLPFFQYRPSTTTLLLLLLLEVKISGFRKRKKIKKKKN